MSQKVAKIYTCEKCDYVTSKKSDFNKHLSTRKHKIRSSVKEISQCLKDFKCGCGKEYKHQSSLWNHKKICTFIQEQSEKEDEKENKEDEKDKIIIEMAKQLNQLNNYVKNQDENQVKLLGKVEELQDTVKNQTPVTNHTTNVVNNFNLNVFLNEDCKDALNLTDFVNSIQLQLHDLENMGKMGYVEGISNIIIKNLNTLDKEKRPIHCTDSKRNTLYIKDNDTWEKDNKDESKVELVVKEVEANNYKQLAKWMNENPQVRDPQSTQSNEFHKMIQSFTSNDEPIKMKKVINKIAKAVPVKDGNS